MEEATPFLRTLCVLTLSPMGNSSTLRPSFKDNSFYCYSPEDIIKIAPRTVLYRVCIMLCWGAVHCDPRACHAWCAIECGNCVNRPAAVTYTGICQILRGLTFIYIIFETLIRAAPKTLRIHFRDHPVRCCLGKWTLSIPRIIRKTSAICELNAEL